LVRRTGSYLLKAICGAAPGVIGMTIIMNWSRKLKGLLNGYFEYINICKPLRSIAGFYKVNLSKPFKKNNNDVMCWYWMMKLVAPVLI